ncbi:LOW QUALITY PROTEIN: oxysterol-binding protein-related protein 6-like [Ruditapes philippinarum]|uniref:LOW QUALITY PROTEIN: oxysterol-binding protein-related protein 6-like n=1 Tax=Ruditapes philippinarum TaxID=129788 RepID=UPI00295AE9A7|nr:LOW QUALITY PROTEIN: oxysterol-binding protein-related protein 6-like [Ruditapes philippinarum]
MSAAETGGQDKIPVLKRSPGGSKKQYQFRHSDSESDSDGESEDNSSAVGVVTNGNRGTDSSSAQTNKLTPGKGRIKGRKSRSQRSQRNDWEIVEGLRDGQRFEKVPEKFEGYLSKRKRWPMKGWHKRYFMLEKGILYYGKSPSDIQKGKYHGVIDIGLSVLAFKRYRHRIDIDAEELVYHIKIKRQVFEDWLTRLRNHRLYRQHEIAYGTKESPKLTEISAPMQAMENLSTLTANMSLAEKARDSSLHRELSRHPSLKGQDRVATWLLDTQGFEHCNKALAQAQSLLYELHKDMEEIRELPFNTENAVFDLNDSDTNDKKKNRSFGGRVMKRRDHKRNASLQESETIASGNKQISSQPATPQICTTPPSFKIAKDQLRSSASNPNLHVEDRPRPSSAPMQLSPQHAARIEEIKLRDSFMSKAEQMHDTLRMLLHSMATERDRLKQTVDMDNTPVATGSALGSSHSGAAVTSLKQTLAEVCQQNKLLKARLAKIHGESSLSDLHLSSPPPSPIEHSVPQLTQSFSAESCSMSEYYDAVEENNAESLSDSSSERSDEEISSDISDDNDTEVSMAHSASEDNILTKFQTGRRSKLPVPKPDKGDVSLWNLLFRNIGKDLTKISMPVTLNEPLSMLQRLCEELEYSDLIDKATEYNDPYERMIYIAAFAVSSYASSCYRVGHKPFNPLLGETYENVREDRGWRFVAEQVSHHPPISACYCDSKHFKLWQDVQIKTKFWGKSMEIQPLGVVNVLLPKFKDHYRWNKVTTCVHNILGGQRWVDQFGEMTITNGNIVCKLTFTKASHYYQSDKRHEVYGTILNPEGKVVHNLFGKWNEALYCGHAPSARCIWRPGTMPEDYEVYYGFSRFAMELNEVLPDEASMLAPTDSRFRPDQRLLEEGKINEAELEKSRVETLQRDRRKKREAAKEECKPVWFKKEKIKGKDYYSYDNRYWECRKEPGFMKMTLPKIW